MIRLLQATLNNKEVRQNMEKEQKIRTWHQTVDFDSLMHEARKHITALAGKVWSDHNGSDPGITQLEVIAFCIADLSYRTSFDVKDILASYTGDKQESYDLPLADVALSNHPVTIRDLRKVLIDMTHPDKVVDASSPNELLIRNAFPVVWNSSEIPFSAVTLEGSTTLEIQAHKRWEEIRLNGLYKIQIEFEDDRSQTDGNELPNHLKDLNQNYFETTIPIQEQEFTISVLFPYWDEIDWSLKDALLNSSIDYVKRENSNEDHFIAVDKLSYDDYFYDYFARVKVGEYEMDASIKIKTKIRSSITMTNGDVYTFSANFLDWNELSNGVKRKYFESAVNLTLVNIQVSNVSIEGEPQTFDLRTRCTFSLPGSDGILEEKVVKLLTRVVFDEEESIPTSQFDEVKSALEEEFDNLVNSKIELEEAIYDLMHDNGEGSIYESYQAKLARVHSNLYGAEGVWSHLGQYRNVCEDFARITASRVQEIALFGKLLVRPNFNVNEILAEIYFQMDQFLNPMVHFYSLSEMIEEGYQFSDLFNGPLLEHGFIKDEDLENLNGRSTIYTSDLIRIIMDVDGVEAVEDFSISNYIDNRLIGRNVINCLSLMNSDVYKPRFSGDKTAFKVFVNGKLEKTDNIVLTNLYQSKLEAKKSLQISNSNNIQLQLPKGRDRGIQDYRSIQHDFPEIYGIGDYGLPIDATEERKARAKQLKAFLLPIEQLLANYLKQVANLPELFSYSRSIDSTYAFQPLYDVPDVQPLFEGFVRGNETWEVFIQDLTNSYEIAMREGESENEFLDRRNRFLSQQLARFGESFMSYSVQMLDRNKHLLDDPLQINTYLEKRAETLEQLIDDKITFAEDYQKVSGARYNAFNITQNSWDNDNIGSYKLRLCRLLGIKTVNNSFLFGKGENGEDLEGMHIVEHILLRPYFSTDELLALPNRLDELGESFVYDSDLDPYSFKLTIVLPLDAGRFAEEKYRSFVEQLIRYETPAHILVFFKWLNTECGKKFEADYSVWKKYVSVLNPSFFQRNNPDSHYETNFNVEPFLVTGSIGPEESFFEIRNRLIQTLNQQCPAPVVPMYMKFFENGIEMTSEPYIFDLSDGTKSYEIQCHPRGTNRAGYAANGGGLVEWSELTERSILEDHSKSVFNVEELLTQYGTGPYHLSLYKDVSDVITKEFSIIGPLPEIKLFQNGVELSGSGEEFDLYLDEGECNIQLNKIGGTLRVEKSNGELFFGNEIIKAEYLNADLRLEQMLEDGTENPFTIRYELFGKLTNIQVNVFSSKTPIPVEIRILDRRINPPSFLTHEVLPENSFYHFIFDYELTKHLMDITFFQSQSMLPGTLVLVEDDGTEIEKPFPSGRMIFEADDLPSGDYQATYLVNKKAVFNFELRVTNINPTFVLEDVQFADGKYTLIASPLYPNGSVYVWRLNGVYATRKLTPEFTFDFSQSEEFIIKLTIHKNDTEVSFEMTVTNSSLDDFF